MNNTVAATTTPSVFTVYYGPWGSGYSRHSFKTLEAARAYAAKVLPVPAEQRRHTATDAVGCLEAGNGCSLDDLYGPAPTADQRRAVEVAAGLRAWGAEVLAERAAAAAPAPAGLVVEDDDDDALPLPAGTTVHAGRVLFVED